MEKRTSTTSRSGRPYIYIRMHRVVKSDLVVKYLLFQQINTRAARTVLGAHISNSIGFLRYWQKNWLVRWESEKVELKNHSEILKRFGKANAVTTATMMMMTTVTTVSNEKKTAIPTIFIDYSVYASKSLIVNQFYFFFVWFAFNTATHSHSHSLSVSA